MIQGPGFGDPLLKRIRKDLDWAEEGRGVATRKAQSHLPPHTILWGLFFRGIFFNKCNFCYKRCC